MEILFEDFEDASVGYTTSVTEFSDGSEDYFGRVAPSPGLSVASAVSYDDQIGDGYFGGQDIDAATSSGDQNSQDFTQSLSWEGISITGLSDISFSAYFAEDDDGSNEDWDDADFFLAEYSIDGGERQNLFAIRAQELRPNGSASTTNKQPRVDADFDGVGEGTAITDSFQLFSAAIAGTGDLLDLHFTLSLNSGDEDIAFDNVRVTAVPEPTSLILTGIAGVVGSIGFRRRRRQN